MTESSATKGLTLEERIQRLEDLEEIRQLMVRYAAAMDNSFDSDGTRKVRTRRFLSASNFAG